ncbi:Dyp-type peroxidase [Microbacterium hatanonis]|uniref:Dyp-type peroxidase n=1 Tax=Microbacterium hatanonis TaxID=404366 RepID=A0A5C8I016_9MICO|nr:Dyp-type peroxidase [Microbacterium hatanonis]TXK12196.1 Dyp-type peroxidase [Microbacterium hatanonis]
MSNSFSRRVPIEAQKVDAPLTSSATFLVVTVAEGADAADTVRDVISGIDDITKNVGFRDLDAQLSCTVGIGSRVWPRLTSRPAPVGLHPFTEFAGAKHTARSTPGDLLFHIRANRHDLAFEFERQLLDAFGGAVTVVDETTGFRYFDVRDLLGFVDGTANPVGNAVAESTLVGDEDHDNAGGSYVVVQKYLHDLDQWQALTTEQQESIIGRKKADNVELDDADTGQKSHKTLSTIVVDGVEHDILRDNMPFGSPGTSLFGTYFIGYSRHLWVTEKMLERMFVGDPPGLYDRILDFSEAVLGCTFFAPSADFLGGLADDPTPAPPTGPMSLDDYLGVGDAGSSPS